MGIPTILFGLPDSIPFKTVILDVKNIFADPKVLFIVTCEESLCVDNIMIIYWLEISLARFSPCNEKYI